MKKITLSIGLLIGILTSSAQDTTCTFFAGVEVYEFDYQTSIPLFQTIQTSKFYEIEIKNDNVLCLDLSDRKNTTRKVICFFSDGSKREDILESKNNVYFSPPNAIKVLVGEPKLKTHK
jgi:hypothetical protein